MPAVETTYTMGADFDLLRGGRNRLRELLSTSHSPTCLIGLHWSPATPLDIQPGGAGVHWSPVETQWTPTKSSPPQPTPIGLQPKSNQVQPTLSRLQGEIFGSDWTPTRLQLESNETLATSVFYATVGCVRNHYLSHSCHQSSSHSYQTPSIQI